MSPIEHEADEWLVNTVQTPYTILGIVYETNRRKDKPWRIPLKKKRSCWRVSAGFKASYRAFERQSRTKENVPMSFSRSLPAGERSTACWWRLLRVKFASTSSASTRRLIPARLGPLRTSSKFFAATSSNCTAKTARLEERLQDQHRSHPIHRLGPLLDA